MTQIKAGKRPVSQRTKPTRINSDDIFGNTLGLEPELTKVIESKGYVYRFINAVNFKRYGRHEAHWKPVNMKTLKEWGYDMIDTHSFLSGTSPDEYIYRGNDLVLAVRPKDINERHKAYLKQEAEARGFSNKKYADELREVVKSRGLNEADVTEGYDDESE